MPTRENAALYAKYKELADSTPDVYFAGRLGTYKYYNMDQVVAQALALYAKIKDASATGLIQEAMNGSGRRLARALGRD